MGCRESGFTQLTSLATSEYDMRRPLCRAEAVENIQPHLSQPEGSIDAESQAEERPYGSPGVHLLACLLENVAVRGVEVMLQVLLGQLGEVLMLGRPAECG
jgi:hypothetical protein